MVCEWALLSVWRSPFVFGKCFPNPAYISPEPFQLVFIRFRNRGKSTEFKDEILATIYKYVCKINNALGGSELLAGSP